jgi:hypothetical protein
MALNVDTQDLDNYPGTTKRVSVDQESIVPAGFEGDEQYVINVSTTAYSDNTNNTTIQDLYIMDFKAGWCKSSGFAGSAGKFDVDSTHYKLNVKMDNSTTTSGSSIGNGYYEIELAYNDDDTPITGEALAADIEEKIRAISVDTEDTGFALSYLNASVDYTNGRFWIISGNMGSYFTGDNRTSVRVLPAATMDCSAELGFNLPIDSETSAAVSIKETSLASNYTTNTTPMSISPGTGVTTGDALSITDGVNTDYFVAISGTTDTSVVVPTSGNNGFIGINNSYTTTSGARVQILREQDPDGTPEIYHDNVDSIVRFGIKTMINQIDYSS